ncbi:hypothetical protein M413DRAFT_444337 [Hebeloma cylindrosporum]|uniref:DUF654-domain-containing protein n=1 Tax=Hebeloma cylindrosporum TaxID=76867 RepID=A0A0C2YNS5_HEBCY|nr:hypothetical protein M413DRAFT_444337 [Hebeloma cylindrosporum h7]
MPPRLNKRQQRELEELGALNLAKASQSNDVVSDDEEPGPSHRGGGFMNLLTAQDSDDGEEEEEEEEKTVKRKSKKKKKKPPQAAPDAQSIKDSTKSTRTSTPVPPVKNEKKALKKARAKEKKAANDELDQVLAELSIQYPSSQKISQATSGKQSLTDLLSVSLQHLDGDAEMRRFFGSRVVTANRDQSSSRKKVAPVKSNLTRPQPTWWAAKGREGLSLRSFTDEEIDAKLKRHNWNPVQEKWWTVEYSKKYKSMTKAFMDTVLSGDPQGFWDLLGTLPWHADTLLQISEVYRHRDEHAQAVDFIDRALFTYERALIGAFPFTTGLNRLDFDHVENRPFFLAVHRQVADLQRRGCVRTSFEFARLLYSLDPWNDPHGSLLHLDFLAIKAGMSSWLVDVFDTFGERRVNNTVKPDARLDPSLLPGWAYSRALALKVSEDATKDKDHTKSTLALKEAALDFPSIVPLLADKLDVILPANIRAHRDFKIETDAHSLSASVGMLHLLSHLYVQRSFSLWKDHTEWLTSAITEAFTTLPTFLPVTERRNSFLAQYQNTNLRYSVYRHIMVLETSYKRLFSFIPRVVLEAKSLACDPLPPPTSVNQYDQDFFHGIDDLYSPRIRSRRQRANDERRLAQFNPDGAFRQQLQAFFDAHPHFAERFPGGILQFAQMAGQLPPDVLEDLMLVEAINAPGGVAPGAMPGGFGDMQAEMDAAEDVDANANVVNVNFVPAPVPGAVRPQAEGVRDVGGDEQGDEDTDEGEDDDEEEEYISPMPRVLRNILGRFWGRNAQAEESSSEDEAPPLDDTGVD